MSKITEPQHTGMIVPEKHTAKYIAERREKMRKFGEEVWRVTTERVAEGSMGEAEEELMEFGEELGLCRRIKYDPNIHEDVSDEYEPGDSLWYWGDM